MSTQTLRPKIRAKDTRDHWILAVLIVKKSSASKFKWANIPRICRSVFT